MKVEIRKRVGSMVLALSASLVSGSGISAEEFIEVVVDPPRGPVETSFTITVRNRTGSVFKLDTCAGPRISSVADGREVYCPLPPRDPCGALPIAPGGTAVFQWVPVLDLCEGAPVEPGLYQVDWKEQPEVLAGRVEVLPEAAHELLVRAEPPVVRAGETVYITVENTSDTTLTFNRCCNGPDVLDPLGRRAHCRICLACFVPEELPPGHVRSYEWTAGTDTCGIGESLPGPHRIQWGGFRNAATDEDARYSGVASILVLPPEGRRLDLELAKPKAAPGELLEITAVNPLDVPVYHAFCCDTAIFIDSEGRRSPCSECRLRCAISYGTEILPGDSFQSGFPVPERATCGLRPGKWSVIWGPNFALDPRDPGEPVYGYAELEVVEGGVTAGFVRGNCNGSTELDLSDAVFLLTHLFLGGAVPGCPDACDADDSGELDVTDAVAFLNYLFLGGTPPPPPFPDAGEDPTADQLGACP